METEQIRGYLHQLNGLFPIDGFLKEDTGKEAIQTYYTQCAWVYGLLVSREGAVHLALNPDGRYDPKGLEEQPRLVQAELDRLSPTKAPRRVLEIGCGKGYNSDALARHNPDVRFCGIDLTPAHVALANEKARRRPNLTFHQADYHALPFPDASFDLVFGIECLCHARDLAQVLSEVRRVLRPGGRFVLTDGFRRAGFDACDPVWQLAAQMVELSMTVERFWPIDRFLATAQAVGFTVSECRDLSQAIQPHLRRLQRVALLYLRVPALARLLTRWLPRYLVRHAVTGLLGAETLHADVQGYYAVTLDRD